MTQPVSAGGPDAGGVPETRAEREARVRALSPADLAAGPGALPDAPMAMPEQVLEPAHRSLIGRLFGGPDDSAPLVPPAAPPAGTGA